MDKHIVKYNSEVVNQSIKTQYNPEFVKMILDASKSKKRTVINPNDLFDFIKTNTLETTELYK